MSQTEFDKFAGNYQKIHSNNIGITGEAPEYFATYKMRDFGRIVDEFGAPIDGVYLDFGSGIGASIAPFRTRLPAAKLICTDVSAESLAVSKAAHGVAAQYSLIQDDRIPLSDASVDGAFACCVFHHIPQSAHQSSLNELRRVLKPGAPLMLYEHNPYNPLTVHAVNTCPLDTNAVLIKAREMRNRCVQSGYVSVKIAYRVYFPAALSGLRRLEEYLRWLPLGAQYYICAQA